MDVTLLRQNNGNDGKAYLNICVGVTYNLGLTRGLRSDKQWLRNWKSNTATP